MTNRPPYIKRAEAEAMGKRAFSRGFGTGMAVMLIALAIAIWLN